MMPLTPLGQTTLRVSPVGLGTVKLGRTEGVRYPHAFTLPTEDEISRLLVAAKASGINLIDTAPAYGTSEERLGKQLQGNRDEWVICTKVGEEFVNGQSHFDFSPQGIRESLARSLKRLKTDRIDIVLVHSNGEDKKIIEQDAVFETLSALKKAGDIRAYGMSTKTVEGGLMAVAASDLVMVTYNPLMTEEKSVIEAAFQQRKGVFIKKALASGHLQQLPGDNPVQTTMDFIFKAQGVTSVILGTLNIDHLKSNVACVASAIISSKKNF